MPWTTKDGHSTKVTVDGNGSVSITQDTLALTGFDEIILTAEDFDRLVGFVNTARSINQGEVNGNGQAC